MGLRVFSYGGGVQSTAALVLAANAAIDFRTFLFANVGADSEDPETLIYLNDFAKPYAAEHGIELHELKKVGRWLKDHGASADNPATVGIGISLDEIHRVNARQAMPYEQPVYPLLDHNPPLRRGDCQRVILGAGLPVPPKSACWFCPFHRPDTWAEMRRDRPALFARACALEDLLNARRAELGKDPVWLTRFNRPLSQLPAAQQMLPLLDDDLAGGYCDNGACFT